MSQKNTNSPANSREQLVQELLDYWKKIAGWIKQKWFTLLSDNYEESQDFQDALAYYKGFQKQEGVEYSPVVAYARERYDRLDKTDKTLDEKADSIIKYLGGGTALITFGALMSTKMDNAASRLSSQVCLTCLLPSLICGLVAVWLAVRVRRPRGSALSPSVKFAVEIAEFYKIQKDIDSNLWLVLHPVCEALCFRNLQKARLVELAHKWYMWAMGLLVLPVFGIIISLGSPLDHSHSKVDKQDQTPAIQKK